MSNEALKSLTMSFFYGDADDKIPERLAAVNPVKLVRAINREFLKRNRRKHATLNLFKVTSNMLAFLKYFDIARKDLKGYEFDNLLSAINFTMDRNVRRENYAAAKLIPNGGIAFTHHGTVTGLDDRPIGSWEISNKKIRKTIISLSETRNTPEEHEREPFSFSILNRRDDGVEWTRKIPDELSATGQTVIVLPLSWAKAWPKKDINGKTLLIKAAESSSSEHAFVRVFKDRSFVYSSKTLPDHLDDIVDTLSYQLGRSPDDAMDRYCGVIYPEYSGLEVYVKRSFDFSVTQFSKIEKLLSSQSLALIKTKFAKEYSYKNTGQLRWFPQIFNNKMNRPVSYCNGLRFFDIAEENNGNLIALSFNGRIGKRIESFAETAPNALELVIKDYPVHNAKVFIQKLVNSGKDTEECFDWDSHALRTRFASLQNEIESLFNEQYSKSQLDREEWEHDFLLSDVRFEVLIFVDYDPNPSDIQRQVLNLSEIEPSLVALEIPKYGYFQGFSEGELDTGNESFLVPWEEEEL